MTPWPSPTGYSTGCMSTPAASSSPGARRPSRPGLALSSAADVSESVRASDGCGVLLRRHPVELYRVRVAEYQVEDPPVADIEPVVGQLLPADLVMHQPCPVRAWPGVLGPVRRSIGARAFPMPLDVLDRLA